MVFRSTASNGGVRDERINSRGRISREKPLNRELKERYLVELLRKLRPLQAQSITKVARIMNDDKATDQNTLKAAAMLITLYKDLVKDAYGRDEETEDEESVEPLQEECKPKLFSLTMVPQVPKE